MADGRFLSWSTPKSERAASHRRPVAGSGLLEPSGFRWGIPLLPERQIDLPWAQGEFRHPRASPLALDAGAPRPAGLAGAGPGSRREFLEGRSPPGPRGAGRFQKAEPPGIPENLRLSGDPHLPAAFAGELAREVVDQAPSMATLERSKALRGKSEDLRRLASERPGQDPGGPLHGAGSARRPGFHAAILEGRRGRRRDPGLHPAPGPAVDRRGMARLFQPSPSLAAVNGRGEYRFRR